MNGIAIGEERAIGRLPAEVDVEGEPYWLVRLADGRYRLLCRLCPHAGGEIRPHDGVFLCPLHFWTFDGESGRCLNKPDEALRVREVEVRDGVLIALPEAGVGG